MNHALRIWNLHILTTFGMCSLKLRLESKVTPRFFTLGPGWIVSSPIYRVHFGIFFVWRSCAKTINSIFESLRHSLFANIQFRTSNVISRERKPSRTLLSLVGFTFCQIVLSLAYLSFALSDLFSSFSRDSTYFLYNRQPILDLCTAPSSTEMGSDIALSIVTRWVRPLRFDSNHFMTVASRPFGPFKRMENAFHYQVRHKYEVGNRSIVVWIVSRPVFFLKDGFNNCGFVGVWHCSCVERCVNDLHNYWRDSITYCFGETSMNGIQITRLLEATCMSFLT